MSNIITAAERAARRNGQSSPVAAPQTVNTVRWHKKGCKTCKPIVVPTRQVVAKMQPPPAAPGV